MQGQGRGPGFSHRRLLLVSDLNETLVGDDAASAEFKRFWEGEDGGDGDGGAAARGCVLVYNTGRSLSVTERMLRDKAHCLPAPHALVCSLGTRIYWRRGSPEAGNGQDAGSGNARASGRFRLGGVAAEEGGEWVEDEAWTARMDEGWSSSGVAEACKGIVERVSGAEKVKAPSHMTLGSCRAAQGRVLCGGGKSARDVSTAVNLPATTLIRPTQAPGHMTLGTCEQHKVVCRVHASFADEARAGVEEALSRRGLQAHVITSGQGEWRFLTLVPVHAGKLAAQEHVRARYGFDESSTVSCGDSGNDRLMLAGRNPAIVVGNAEEDLLQWARQQQVLEAADASGGGAAARPGRLYVAKANEALGVLEGLAALGFR